MRKGLLVLSLALLALVTMGAGWLSGPRFGAGLAPGFAPVQRVAAGDTPEPPWFETWSSLADECIRAYSADYIVQGGVGSYDYLLDSSPSAIHGVQTNESYKVLLASDSNGFYFTCGGNRCFIADRPILATYTCTVVFKLKNDNNYAGYITIETAAPWSAPTRHAFGFGFEGSGQWPLGWLGNADYALGSRAGIATDAWHVISTTFCPSASASIRVDGAHYRSFTSASVGNGSGFASTASSCLYLGGYFTGGAQSYNDVRCIMLYAPTGDLQSRIEAALVGKYL